MPVGDVDGLFKFSGKDRLLVLAMRGDIESSGARNCLSRWEGECDNPGRTGRLLTCVYRGLTGGGGSRVDSKYAESVRMRGSSVFCLERGGRT